MSKMDDLRAMREARYAQSAGGAAGPASARTATKRPAARRADVPPAAVGAAPPVDVRCGHRAISGRTCTREQGHSEKSHRYS